VVAEVAGEVGLVVEPHVGRHLGRRAAVEELAAGGVDPPAEHVRVGRYAERPAEAPHQVGGRRPELGPGGRQRHRLEQPLVEQVAQPGGQARRVSTGRHVGLLLGRTPGQRQP
jgi:hypothetical protein